MRGTSFGEFDHATWVTMTEKGPRLANLRIDGILPDDVTTEAHQQFWRSLAFEEYFSDRSSLDGKLLTLSLRNFFDFEIKGNLNWQMPGDSTLTVSPAMTEMNLKAGEERTVKFTIEQDSNTRLSRFLPRLEIRFGGGEKKLELEAVLDIPVEK